MTTLSSKTGFTIIESLISLILLGIVLTGGMKFYYHSQELISRTSHKKIALHTANGLMETFRKNGYGALPAAGVAVTSAITTGNLQYLSASSTVLVTDVDDPTVAGSPDYKSVRVTVNWTETGEPSARTVDLLTYMAP